MNHVRAAVSMAHPSPTQGRIFDESFAVNSVNILMIASFARNNFYGLLFGRHEFFIVPHQILPEKDTTHQGDVEVSR
jgi:hypothetical protein